MQVRYRYALYRQVQAQGPRYLYVGINPSTADDTVDDATVRKWKAFTRGYGGGSFLVGNVFAVRATDVKELQLLSREGVDVVGADNDGILTQMADLADYLVPCWGNVSKAPKELQYRFDEVNYLLAATGKPLKSFGTTSSGCPKHPLFLASSTELKEYKA